MHLHRNLHRRPRCQSARPTGSQRRDDEGQPWRTRRRRCGESRCDWVEKPGCARSAVQDCIPGLYGSRCRCQGELLALSLKAAPADTRLGRLDRCPWRLGRWRRGPRGLPQLAHAARSRRAEEHGQLGQHLPKASVEYCSDSIRLVASKGGESS